MLDVVYLPRATDQKLLGWIGRHLKHEGLSATADVCRALLARCGHAMDVLAGELAKLAAVYSDVWLVVFGPFEAPVYRADGRYRLRMVVKCLQNRRTLQLFGELLDVFGKQKPETPLLTIDFNPSNL